MLVGDRTRFEVYRSTADGGDSKRTGGKIGPGIDHGGGLEGIQDALVASRTTGRALRLVHGREYGIVILGSAPTAPWEARHWVVVELRFGVGRASMQVQWGCEVVNRLSMCRIGSGPWLGRVAGSTRFVAQRVAQRLIEWLREKRC